MVEKNYRHWIILVLLLVLVEVLKTQPAFLENWYATGIYPVIGVGLRWIFGWIPFSIGDLIIGLLVAWSLVKIVIFFKYLFKGKSDRRSFINGGLFIIRFIAWVFIIFHILWGFNYYRLGSAHLLGITPEVYTTPDVDSLTAALQRRISHLASDSLTVEAAKTHERSRLKKAAEEAYKAASKRYPFLAFSQSSLKPNLIGPLQSYTGYSGYLLPITGEAHANFYAPSFTLPYTVCHEMAHQLGFGTESEANLIGFLAARESANPALVYSAYAGVHQYALSELYNRDSLRARAYIDSFPALLKKDRIEMRTFMQEHQSFLQPVLNSAYNLYLLGNNQPQGLESYNRVVAWLVAYAKKYGWESL